MNSYPECNAVVNKASAAIVGEARTAQPQKTMGAEDFSYFLQERPGTYYHHDVSLYLYHAFKNCSVSSLASVYVLRVLFLYFLGHILRIVHIMLHFSFFRMALLYFFFVYLERLFLLCRSCLTRREAPTPQICVRFRWGNYLSHIIVVVIVWCHPELSNYWKILLHCYREHCL